MNNEPLKTTVESPSHFSAPRLTAVFLLMGLIFSRVALALHEFCGHGLSAALCGQRVTGWAIFVFGGAWISFGGDAPLSLQQNVFVHLAGPGINIATGLLALAIQSRLARGSLSRMTLLAFGCGSVGYSIFYLVRGAHYGFGDGLFLVRTLAGWQRPTAVFLGALALVAAVFFMTRAFMGQAASWLPESGAARRFFLVLVCGGIAAGLHFGLFMAEKRLLPDPAYELIMENESSRLARQEVERIAGERRVSGQKEMDAETRMRLRAKIEQEKAPFPLDFVLMPAMLLAAAMGGLAPVAARPRKVLGAGEQARPMPSWAETRRLAMVCLLILAAAVIFRRPW